MHSQVDSRICGLDMQPYGNGHNFKYAKMLAVYPRNVEDYTACYR